MGVAFPPAPQSYSFADGRTHAHRHARRKLSTTSPPTAWSVILIPNNYSHPLSVAFSNNSFATETRFNIWLVFRTIIVTMIQHRGIQSLTLDSAQTDIDQAKENLKNKQEFYKVIELFHGGDVNQKIGKKMRDT